MAFQIFDRKTIPLLEARYSTGTPVIADTLTELLDGIEKRYGVHSFDKRTALATVTRFNEAANDAAGFDPNALDRKSTRGLDPEKTNWAIRVDEGPFRAYAVTGGITFTFGGLRIDEHARVLDGADRPIPALFATGEAMGFYWINYPGASGLTRGAVFGKIAGEGAAELALQNKARSAH